MPNPNAIVSTVARVERREPAAGLDAAGAQPIGIELGGGRRVTLDPADPRSAALARVLEGIGREGTPVYLELVPDTDRVRFVRLAKVSRVASVRDTGEGLEVMLVQSHARLRVPKGAAVAAEMEAALRQASGSRGVLMVTANDAGEIIDVRTPPAELKGLPFTEPEVLPPRRSPIDWIRSIYRWPGWPWWWFGCISALRAQQVFDAMKATSCDPLTVPAPCIPFLYPDDGCWGRAHEMCRLMIQQGLTPRKVWIMGRLTAQTKNNPMCHVNWAWHVAPTLCVRSAWWLLWLRRTMVIDPSLFGTPVTEAQWKGAQGDPSASLTETPWTDFLFGATDPTFSQTNAVLADYRSALQLRAIQDGPPPYANCP